MNKVDFNYNGSTFIIQCNNDDKMKIVNKFLTKCEKNKKNIFFLYNGQILNEELVFNRCANNLDKSRNYMNVLVIEQQYVDDDSNKFKKSDYIICPKCNERAYISIKDFKFTIYGCKNGHITENLNINEFTKSQSIDQSKILCNNCNISKFEINNDEFFRCYTCEQNVCNICKNSHEKSHILKSYELYNYYCDLHCDLYINYCDDCKIDLCAFCEKDHKNHKIITYGSLLPDMEKIEKNDLQNTKEIIVELKSSINDMSNHLNNLNKNLDIYFDIYNDIISHFNYSNKEYSVIQNVNEIEKYNNNFIGFITEIIRDNNIESKFNSIINLQNKLYYKEEGKIQENHNTIGNEKEHNDKDDNIYGNEQKYKPLDDKYDNFHLNLIQKLDSFKIKNYVITWLILSDERILLYYQNDQDNGEPQNKLSIYSKTKIGFVCDINNDYDDYIFNLYLMDDGLVIIISKNYTKIVKFKKNEIEEINTIKCNFSRLSNTLFKSYKKLYFYEQGKLVFDKELPYYQYDEGIKRIYPINEDEHILFTEKNRLTYDNNDFLIFYDIKNNKRIKTLKVGNGDHGYNMLLINKNNLIVTGESGKFFLIDTKNRIIKWKNKCSRVGEFIKLSEKIFLVKHEYDLYQFEFDGSGIELKEKTKIENDKIMKYPGNKLIFCYDNNIIIYG